MRFAFAALFFVACSSSSSAPAPDPTGDPGGGGGTTPPPAPCADGTYRAAPAAACVPYPKLSIARSPTAITPVRDHHTTAVVEMGSDAYVYVFGGTDNWKTIHLDVQRAKIGADGSLGAFEAVGNLPTPRAGHCIARVGNRFMLAGGIVEANGAVGPSNSSVLVTLGADGKVASTAAGPNLPDAVMHLTCDVSNGFLYAMGGAGGRGAAASSTKMSVRAKITGDDLGAFENQTPLSPDRSHHASFIRGSRLYLVGGLTGDPAGEYTEHKDAVSAPIGDDGKLGAWSPAGNLPQTTSVSSSMLYEDAVYVFGGLDGETFSDQILRATFQDDATLSAFSPLATKLPAARGHVHETPMYKSFVYSVGGQDATFTSVGTVDIGRFE